MSDPPGASPKPPVRRSLRTPIVAAVVLANLVTFLVLLGATEYAARENRREIELDYTATLTDQLDEIVDRTGGIRIEKALNWRGWRRFDDVIVAQRPEAKPAAGSGVLGPEVGVPLELFVPGVYLNPLGRAGRPPAFDEQQALQMIKAAVASGETVFGDLGIAAPIGLPGTTPWGGVWFRQKPTDMGEFPTARLSLLFVAIMALFTALLLWLLQRSVLDPVLHLAGVVRHLESQNLRARVNVPDNRTDEIAELGIGFNQMAQRLQRYSADLEAAVAEATARVKTAEAAAMTQRRLAATGELAAGVAHELNNPLGGLANAVESLGSDKISPERRAEYLMLVRSGLERMGATVGRLLRLAPREAQVDQVDLAGPLADALGLIRHRAEAMGVEIRVAGPQRATGESAGPGGWAIGSGPRLASEPDALDPMGALPAIRGAANELGQAILNLLVNALDAIEEGRSKGQRTRGPGCVEVSLSVHGDSGGVLGQPSIQIVCVDDGPGIPGEVMDRAADAFFTTKEQGKGTGLGLAIVHNVVAAHGGQVLLESAPGEGFRAVIHLPLTFPRAPGVDPMDSHPTGEGSSLDGDRDRSGEESH